MHAVSELRRKLERGALTPDAAVSELSSRAKLEATRALRSEAYELLGDLSGRAFDSPWEVAERAAWELLAIARRADSVSERRSLILAMGRGFRNLWLVPFVHARLRDDDASIIEAAIHAAGGLGFGGLEDDLTAFLVGDIPIRHRIAAIQALGRLGASHHDERVAGFVRGDPREAEAALTALSEMRSPAGVDAAIELLEGGHERDVTVAAVTYLCEMGRDEALPVLRRLSRENDARLRLSAALASRAFKAERTRDAAERILVALVDRDRAVRAVLARRLRTLPVSEVLDQAKALFADDPEGIVQIAGEVRHADVTRFLIRVAEDQSVPSLVRARAAGTVKAAEPWERDELQRLATSATDESVRVAAVQVLGAFSTLGEVFSRVGALARDPSPAIRAAFLWALQLSTPPSSFPLDERRHVESVLEAALVDDDDIVKRRAAYVAGNLGFAALAPHLVRLADSSTPEHRVAAYVGLGELALSERLGDLISLLRREEEPEAVAAASRAIASTVSQSSEPADLDRLAGKLGHLLGHAEPIVREAAVRLAGLASGAVPASTLMPLLSDASARVRAETAVALGRLRAREGEAALVEALDGADPDLGEQAAEALFAIGTDRARERALAWIVGDSDPEARSQLAARIEIPRGETAVFEAAIVSTLAKLSADDAAYDPLLGLRLRFLDARPNGQTEGPSVEDAIVEAFPRFAELGRVRGFEPLARSLRTAESLHRAAAGLRDADHSPPIVLWMKSLEGYVHAWLGSRLQGLQRQPGVLFEHVDHLVHTAWPSYQKFVRERWQDEVCVGGTSVEVPLRSLSNGLRDYQEHRTKRLDAPLSVTEWARLMVFLAVDHASGAKNLLRVRSTSADRTVRLCHRLAVLAAVRNVVTHRAVAAEQTADAFRALYYAAFEELTGMA